MLSSWWFLQTVRVGGDDSFKKCPFCGLVPTSGNLNSENSKSPVEMLPNFSVKLYISFWNRGTKSTHYLPVLAELSENWNMLSFYYQVIYKLLSLHKNFLKISYHVNKVPSLVWDYMKFYIHVFINTLSARGSLHERLTVSCLWDDDLQVTTWLKLQRVLNALISLFLLCSQKHM